MSGSNFPHGLTSMGMPVIPGFSTFGDAYFVDYRNGLDGNTGKKTTEAFQTLSRAYDACASNQNDVIFIDGDSTVTETAMITWAKNRIHVVGCNGPVPPLGYGMGAKVSLGVTGVATNTATIRVTGVRNTFTGVKFMNSDTVAQSLHCVEEAGEYTRYHGCEFYKSSLLTTDLTAEVLMNGDSSQFYNCTFGDMVNERGASGKERPNVKFDRETVAGKVCRDGSFVGCTFLHKAAHVDCRFLYGKNATDIERRLLIRDCVFWNCILATAVPAQNIAFGATQTVGEVLIERCSAMNAATAMSTTTGVFSTDPVPDTTGENGIAIQST